MAGIVKYRFVLRRGLAADWAAKDEVLLECEIGIETNTGLDTGVRRYKIGDGVTSWNDLPYVSSVAALSALTDVDGSVAPADGDLLRFNSATGLWVATAAPTSGGGSSKISSSSAPVSNAGTSETDLMKYTLQASTLFSSGDCLRFRASISVASTSGSKKFKVKFGSATLYDSATSIPISAAGVITIEGEILRNSSGDQICTTSVVSGLTGVTNSAYLKATNTLSSDVLLKLTGTGGASADLTQTSLTAIAYSAGTGVWTPSELFSAGQAGAWFDPSDLSTLFQDTGATTPVTTAGQSVAVILDKSGNGHHASQATSAKRPTLQIDGSGHYYLAFNGSQYLDCGTAFNADALATCATFNASAANQRIMDSRGVGAFGSTFKGHYLKASNPSGTDGYAVDDGAGHYIGSSHTVSFGSPHVAYFEFNGSNALRYLIDLSAGFTTLTSGTALGSTTSAVVSRIGASSSDGSQGLNGALYALIVVKSVLADTDTTLLRRWAGATGGIAIP